MEIIFMAEISAGLNESGFLIYHQQLMAIIRQPQSKHRTLIDRTSRGSLLNLSIQKNKYVPFLLRPLFSKKPYQG
jgi:hypothetical protein